jgi:hypothetical protein
MSKRIEAEKVDDMDRFDYCEFGVNFSRSKVYRTIKSFMLPVCLGPPICIPNNVRVKLDDKTAKELFLNAQIEPISIPEEYEVLRSFSDIGESGEWVTADVGDIIRLEKNEGLKKWRGGFVKPKEVDSETKK